MGVKAKQELHVFFIHGLLVIGSFRMAEVDDCDSRVAHKDIFTTDISMQYAHAMNGRQC
jgi:hypothetical protein